jgi:hypothetical protein
MKTFVVKEENLFKDSFRMLNQGFGNYVTQSGEEVGSIQKGNRDTKGIPITKVVAKFTRRYYEDNGYPIPSSIKEMYDLERIVKANPFFEGFEFVLVGSSNSFPETCSIRWYVFEQLCNFLSKKCDTLPDESQIDFESEKLYGYILSNGSWIISKNSSDIVEARKKDELIKG